MKRRAFTQLALSTLGALAIAPALLAAGGTQDYIPGLIQSKLDAGETVFVDYAATWCSTCKRQERVLSELRAENPEYDKHISFI